MSQSSIPAPSWRLARERQRAVKPAAPSGSSRRLGAALLCIAGAALIPLSYLLPWWSFTLYAPQYPHGLRLLVSLSSVAGDVREVNMLNHYIGMKSLVLAAPVERALAPYAVFVLAGLVLLAAGLLRGRWQRLAVLFAAVLPVGFLLDSCFWLWRFGHDLDPRAPIKLSPFTPQLFGNGEIGQFMTFAQPQLGFILALLAPVLVACGVLLAGSARSGERATQRERR